MGNPDIANKLSAIEFTGLGLDQHFRHFIGGGGDREIAKIHLESAFQAWLQTNEEAGVAMAAYELAVVQWGLSEMEAAAKYLGIASEYWGRQNHPRQGGALNLLGLLHWRKGDLPTAERYYQMALELRVADGHDFYAAQIENNLGLLAMERGEYKNAQQRFLGTLAKTQGPIYDLVQVSYGTQRASVAEIIADLRSGHLKLALVALNNFAVLQDKTGAPQKAVPLWETYLQLAPNAADRRTPGYAANNLGITYLRQGEIEKARFQLRQALRTFEELSDAAGVASAHHSLGNYYLILGQYNRAIDEFSSALEHRTAERAAGKRVETLLDLSRTYDAHRNPEKALYIAVEAIQVAGGLDSPSLLAAALVVASRLATHQRSYDDAAKYLNRTRSISREKIQLRTLAEIEYSSGELALSRNLHQLAASHFSSTVELTQQGWNVELQAKAQARFSRTQRQMGRHQVALHAAERAVVAADRLRARVRSPRARASMMSAVRLAYFEKVASLVSLGKPLEAWVASQQARSRTLWETKQESSDFALSANQELLSQHESLRTKFSALANGLAEDNQPSSEEFARLQLLIEELETVEGKIASHAAADPLSSQFNIAAAQQFIASLDNETAVLEHVTGDGESIGFVVTSAGVSTWNFDNQQALRPKLEAAINSVSNPTNLVDLNAFRYLSEQLLAPLDYLDQRRLILITDAYLRSLPFSVLPDPASNSPLLEHREIIYVDSIPTLDNTSWELPKRIAVVANPTLPAVASNVSVSLVRSAFGEIAPLPYAEEEAREINALAPETVKVLLGDQATLENVLHVEFWDSDVLHFATHGLTNTQLPELAGILLVDKDHQSTALRAIDLRQLTVTSSLVVLSACQSGIGQVIQGEGMFSLSRAFRAAGATSTISSLWRVEDRSTSILMKYFYEGILKQGFDPATALQSAQMQTMSDPRTRHPYYWAGFVFEK